MQPITIDQFAAPQTPLTAQQALSGWFALLDDLDTLCEPVMGYLGEDQAIMEGRQAPIHDELDRLEGIIMAYAPASEAEARAIIAIVSHDMTEMELTGEQHDAHRRATAFLVQYAGSN